MASKDALLPSPESLIVSFVWHFGALMVQTSILQTHIEPNPCLLKARWQRKQWASSSIQRLHLKPTITTCPAPRLLSACARHISAGEAVLLRPRAPSTSMGIGHRALPAPGLGHSRARERLWADCIHSLPCRDWDCDIRRNLSARATSCAGIYAGRGTILHFDDTCFLNILIMLLTSRLERRRRLPPLPLCSSPTSLHSTAQAQITPRWAHTSQKQHKKQGEVGDEAQGCRTHFYTPQ